MQLLSAKEPIKTYARQNSSDAVTSGLRKESDDKALPDPDFSKYMTHLMVKPLLDTSLTDQTGENIGNSASAAGALLTQSDGELPVPVSIAAVAKGGQAPELLGVFSQEMAATTGEVGLSIAPLIEGLDKVAAGDRPFNTPVQKTTDAPATDAEGKAHKHDTEGKSIAVPAGTVTGDDVSIVGLNGKAVHKTSDGELRLAEQNSESAGTTNITSHMRHELVAPQQQPESAPAAWVLDRATEGVTVHRAQAADPAESLQNTVAIMKGSNRLAVTLQQEGLGKLNIDLSLNKGLINAHINVADDSARSLIENNLQQIMNSLMKEGLSVGGFSVSLKGGNAGGGDQEKQYATSATPGDGFPEQNIAPASTLVSGQINIFV